MNCNPIPLQERVGDMSDHAVTTAGRYSKRFGCTCGQTFTGRTRTEAWSKWSRHERDARRDAKITTPIGDGER